VTTQEERLLRRARLRLTVLTWAALTTILVAVGIVCLVYVQHEQDRDLRDALQTAVRSGARVAAYSDDISLAVVSPEGTQVSPGSPPGLPVQAAIAAARAAGDGRDERYARAGRVRIRVLTEVQGDRVVQAAVSTEDESDERTRLLTALGLAEILGLLGAAAVGGIVARRAIAPLGLAMQRQRRFVADASHELRTPLTLLSTRAQLLERDLRRPGSPTAHAEALALVADARRIAEVVDDLLVSASLEAQPGRRENIDVVALARTSVEAMTAHAGELGIELTGPVDAAPQVVPGAERPLRRVVDALVDNALGHTRAGGHVAVDVTPRGADWVVVSVIDDGSGLDPAHAEGLFTRFARGSTDNATDGSRRRFGLGLALVREVVEAHRGRVEVDGAPGFGATFRVLLPRGEARS
jgi:two-component system OmpR family sensor kinase